MTTHKAPSPVARRDLYAEVTDSIVASLEVGVRPWAKPWDDKNPAAALPLRHTGEPYRGVNVLALWVRAAAAGYRNPTWMSFKQALEHGGCVRKGEKGAMVVFASSYQRKGEADGEEGDGHRHGGSFLKAYHVFNVEQIDGLPERFAATAPEPPPPAATIDHADRFFATVGARVRHGGPRAFYSPSEDAIVMPDPGLFRDAASYHAVLAHEHVHWTGAASRLDRQFGARFGDRAYAVEELVAELGAAFVGARLGLPVGLREDHAAYLAAWLAVLKADTRAIFTAASKAQEAADFLANAAAPLAVAA